MEPHKNCHYCGTTYEQKVWPRKCQACGATTWINPKPVVVVCVKMVGGGLLTVRRDIEPERGELALPGGYIDQGESFEEAASRELSEETSGLVKIHPEGFSLLGVKKATNGNILIFAAAKDNILEREIVKDFTPNPEVSELNILRAPGKLAWPLHTKFAYAYFVGNMKWPEFT